MIFIGAIYPLLFTLNNFAGAPEPATETPPGPPGADRTGAVALQMS